LLRANERYVFGRPKLDEIEVKFIPDYSIMTANLLAGTVEKLMGVSLPVAQGVELQSGAPQLNVVLADRLGGLLPMWPQFLNPDPPLVGNLEFRRALFQGIDRQEMNDTINYGVGPLPDTWLQPDRVEYPAVERQLVRYGYEPRRTTQVLEGLGYSRGGDGRLRDSAGQPLHLDVRTNDREPIHMPAGLAVTDYWKRLGFDAEITNIPLQRVNDSEYRSTYSAFEIAFSSPNLSSAYMRRWLSTATPLPENQYRGLNRTRYQNAESDDLVNRYVSTIPKAERLDYLGKFLHLQTDRLVIMPLLFNATASVLRSKGLRNVTSSSNWNAHLWERS
jgi:ABC-type transport system substrate-binding protein